MMARRSSWRLAILLSVLAPLMVPAPGHGFSVLAHQGIVDQAWHNTLLPAVRKRFPAASQQDLEDAHSYARGGSHLPDLGYFPLGSRFFTDLLHYVRTGDFTSRLLAEASTAQEYAFALGMLAHYEADSIGHPEATNLAVPIIYPKVEEKYGQYVTYADSPSSHLMTEFRFDVLQVAHRHQIPDMFEQSIDFKVPEQLLERVFRETYGLELKDVFKDYDIALNTYRWGFRTLINEATGIAWQLYREDIQAMEPGMTSKRFVIKISRADFVKQFGNAFSEPGYFVQFIGFLGNVVPNLGPLKRLPFKPLPPEVQKLYFRAFDDAYTQYLNKVAAVRRGRGRLRLANLILDTGQPAKAGQYAPADQAYIDLLRDHARDHFAAMPRGLEEDMLKHFRNTGKALAYEDDQHKREEDLKLVEQFKSASSPARAPSSVSDVR